jgi:hypothetical protein
MAISKIKVASSRLDTLSSGFRRAELRKSAATINPCNAPSRITVSKKVVIDIGFLSFTDGNIVKRFNSLS